MNIEEQKQNFLNLLRESFKAKKGNLGTEEIASILDVRVSFVGKRLDDYEDKERINIEERILTKCGFSESVFWKIICPSLKKEGYIRKFGNLDWIPFEYYERFDGYTKLKNKIRELNEELPVSYLQGKTLGKLEPISNDDISLRSPRMQFKKIEDEIEKTEKELSKIRELARNHYPFFVVNENKLFENTSANQTQNNPNRIDIFIDGEKGIYSKEDGELCYPIIRVRDGKIAKRFKTIRLLCESEFVSASKIESETKQDPKTIKKEVLEINKNFRNKVGMTDDLIISVPTGGYKFNKDKFNISHNNTAL